MELTTAHNRVDERDASIRWLHVKLLQGTAGLDPYDSAVMIVEVSSPEKAWRIDLIGEELISHPWVRPDRSTCIRVRAIIEADVRQAVQLDEPGAPTLQDVPLASLSAAALEEGRASVIQMDMTRRIGRGPR